MIKCCIVEDDPHHSNRLEALLRQSSEQFTVLSISRNVSEAVSNITSDKPELVFLDITLNSEENGGFDILRQIETIDFDVIFTTIHPDWAIKAIRLCALDYLLKPILPEELESAIARFKENRLMKLEQVKTLKANLELESQKVKAIWISNADERIRLEIDDIVYAESDNTTTFFHLAQHTRKQLKHTSTKAIGKWEDLLEGNGFLRIHNSYLVNLDHIVSCKRDIIRVSTGDELPVSKHKKAILSDRLGMK